MKVDPISWVQQPIHCRHAPSGIHYLYIGFTSKHVVYLTCDCEKQEGTEYCAVEHAFTEDPDTCFAVMKTVRGLFKNSYTLGMRRNGLAKALNKIRNQLPEADAVSVDEEHWLIRMLIYFNEQANDIRKNKIRSYNHHRPKSYVGRKAFLLEKFVRRHMGVLAPMFHVHPHEDGEKLVLRMVTTKILTCGLDLKSQRRKHQSWSAARHKYHHSNSASQYCLFCERTYYNMGSHVIGQGHIKRVAEAVNKARRIMSPEGIKTAYE